MSKQLPTLHQLMEEPTNRITFWQTSTDVICPAESPHSYKGTGRHLWHNQVWDLVGSHCPRCNDDWGQAKDGLRPCLTRGCYTWKQTGKHTTPSLMTEEQIMFDEFEDDLHEAIRNDIDRPHPHMGVVVNDYHDKLMKSIDDLHDDMPTDDMPVEDDMPFDIPQRATGNLNNLSSTGDNMSAPRNIESDSLDDMPTDDMPFDTPPHEGATHSPQDTTQNKEEKT